MKLSAKQISELWDEAGPYSEANIKIQTRILEDSVSRVFIIVETNINPLTYKIISQNIARFKNDSVINTLINSAEYMGEDFGYVSDIFVQEYVSEKTMKEANKHLKNANKAIIEMHRFVMDLLGLGQKA